jgi:hypothetical protein
MRRILLIGALVASFGLGVLSGGFLPVAQGQAPGSNPNLPQVVPLIPPYTSVYSVVQGRWQVLSLPSPDRTQMLTMLLDGNTGASYLLVSSRTTRVQFTWERLDRTP